MRPRLLAVLLFLVLVPAGVLGALAFRLAADERALARRQFELLERDRLLGMQGQIDRAVEAVETELLRALTAPGLDSSEAFRAMAKREPLVVQPFWLGPDRVLLHPPVRGQVTSSERAFLSSTLSIWNGEAALYGTHGSWPGEEGRSGGAKSLVELAERASQGWVNWYWEEGTHLLFWSRRAGGGVVGAEVERTMLLSRLVAALPEPALADGRVVLSDLSGQALLQWGPYEPSSELTPSLELSLDAPLSGFALRFYASPEQLASFEGRAIEVGLGFGVLALLLVLAGLAVYLARESSRDLREAARRVSFVTQVSHELKTPLTNVRLYAELLEQELPEEEEKARQRLHVIVAESQRLTRLINNILSFSKQREGKLGVVQGPVVVDEVVRGVLAQFAPAFAAKGIEVETALAAPRVLRLDRDALGQIVGNLLSNAEKYAAAGRWIRVETGQSEAGTTVAVQDRGPGVERDHAERIFEPFFRASYALNDGVTGTGIGLTIARDLARLMGGELRLAQGTAGARFELLLPVVEGEA